MCGTSGIREKKSFLKSVPQTMKVKKKEPTNKKWWKTSKEGDGDGEEVRSYTSWRKKYVQVYDLSFAKMK